MKKIMMAAALAVAMTVSSAHAQVSALGWVSTLSGACWQGANASGVQIDRQCFQIQFNRFLRTNVTRADGFNGASVLGYNVERHRLEMYAWSNRNEPAIYTPEYDDSALSFAEIDGRVIWRRIDANSFEVARQSGGRGHWTDISVITYHRDGAAPAAFEADGSNTLVGSGGFGFLDTEARHCAYQVEPQLVASNRGCVAWEYPHVMRQTWYWGSQAPSGETVMFKHGEELRFFYWDAQGNFGMGVGSWAHDVLYTMKDASPNRRTSMQRAIGGYISTTEARDAEVPGRPWAPDHAIRFQH